MKDFEIGVLGDTNKKWSVFQIHACHCFTDQYWLSVGFAVGQYSVGLDVGGILARNHQWMCRYTFLNV